MHDLVGVAPIQSADAAFHPDRPTSIPQSDQGIVDRRVRRGDEDAIEVLKKLGFVGCTVHLGSRPIHVAHADHPCRDPHQTGVGGQVGREVHHAGGSQTVEPFRDGRQVFLPDGDRRGLEEVVVARVALLNGALRIDALGYVLKRPEETVRAVAAEFHLADRVDPEAPARVGDERHHQVPSLPRRQSALDRGANRRPRLGSVEVDRVVQRRRVLAGGHAVDPVCLFGPDQTVVGNDVLPPADTCEAACGFKQGPHRATCPQSRRTWRCPLQASQRPHLARQRPRQCKRRDGSDREERHQHQVELRSIDDEHDADDDRRGEEIGQRCAARPEPHCRDGQKGQAGGGSREPQHIWRHREPERGERACREAHADNEIVQMVALAQAHPGSRRGTKQDGRDEQYARYIAQPPHDKRIPDVRATETFRPEPEGSHERSWCGARHRGDGEEADIGDPIERKGLPAPAVEHPARQRGPGQAPKGSHPGEGKRLPGGQFYRE